MLQYFESHFSHWILLILKVSATPCLAELLKHTMSMSFSFYSLKMFLYVLGLTHAHVFLECTRCFGSKHLPNAQGWPGVSHPVKVSLHSIEMQESSVWIIDLISQRIHFTKRMTHSQWRIKPWVLRYDLVYGSFLLSTFSARYASTCVCVHSQMYVSGIHFTLHQLNCKLLS